MGRRVHPFTYFVARRDNQRSLRIHQRRDLGATCELQAALLQMGFEYGEPMLNAPPRPPLREPPQSDQLHPVDTSFVRPGDLLLLTTRPPLDDLEHGDRKRVDPGHTDLEDRIFGTWRRYLDVCARSHVKLSPAMRKKLSGDLTRFREMQFREASGAPFKQQNALEGGGWKRPPEKNTTAVFMLRVEELWKGGPGLLSVFGMDGTSTMLWAYRLRKELRHLLREPGFVVAEMRIPQTPVRPTDLRWAEDSEVEIILHHQEEAGTEASETARSS